MDRKSHWSGVYQAKAVTDVSWHQEHPELSVELIRSAQAERSARIIDVGAGASTLVDHLLADGYSDITLLDLSAEALNAVRERLGELSSPITFLTGDVTDIALPEHAFDIWHDRAVFHFLTDPVLRQKYVETARRAVKPGGHVIVATFALDGPTQCSGLTVDRYDAASLHSAFGDGFELLDSTYETHRTPWGSEQKFVYCYCRKTDAQPLTRPIG